MVRVTVRVRVMVRVRVRIRVTRPIVWHSGGRAREQVGGGADAREHRDGLHVAEA